MVSECNKLMQTKYKGRDYNVERYIHWQLCGKCELESELTTGMNRSRRE